MSSWFQSGRPFAVGADCAAREVTPCQPPNEGYKPFTASEVLQGSLHRSTPAGHRYSQTNMPFYRPANVLFRVCNKWLQVNQGKHDVFVYLGIQHTCFIYKKGRFIQYLCTTLNISASKGYKILQSTTVSLCPVWRRYGRGGYQHNRMPLLS